MPVAPESVAVAVNVCLPGVEAVSVVLAVPPCVKVLAVAKLPAGAEKFTVVPSGADAPFTVTRALTAMGALRLKT